ncbi:phosphoribosyltransferase family protein [uncultured Oxalicibacterium sp.]|uniref:ComF family protein n=1 Tax=uncultured Oxalicibacterium sp. TaxID=1168540 RepID=UPI0025D690CA|nr:phosphoribosyltransferase family protein [uncultured Oxalicibacterium sp.]
MPYRFLADVWPIVCRLPQLIPSTCALCSSEGCNLLCTACEQRFFTQPCPRCPQCGLQTNAADQHRACGHCLKTLPDYDATIVATDYVAPIDQAILALKFGHRLAIAPLLARLLHDALLRTPNLALPDVLIAVPLSPQRLAERGFNQSLEIARPLARATGMLLDTHLLQRTRDTAMQTSLPLAERQRNMRHAFVPDARSVERIRGRHIAVLDDVLTTGSTLNAIAGVLKRHGAQRVTNLVVARTPAR